MIYSKIVLISVKWFLHISPLTKIDLSKKLKLKSKSIWELLQVHVRYFSGHYSHFSPKSIHFSIWWNILLQVKQYQFCMTRIIVCTLSMPHKHNFSLNDLFRLLLPNIFQTDIFRHIFFKNIHSLYICCIFLKTSWYRIHWPIAIVCFEGNSHYQHIQNAPLNSCITDTDY